eukprot:gene8287-11217_t
MVSSLIFVSISIGIVSSQYLTIPSCGVEVTYNQGLPDPVETIYNCSESTSAPYQPVTAFLGAAPINVSAQLVLNNLVYVDDMQQTVTMDFKFRLQWHDNRFNLPQLFAVLNPNISHNGFELTQMYYSGSNPLQIWRPDLHFVDAQSVTVTAESFRLKNHGVVYWSRHLSVLISQSQFTYKDYPLDPNNIQIRFESYSLPKDDLFISFVNPAVELYASQDQLPNIMSNPLWKYNGYFTELLFPNYQFYESDPPRIFSQAVITVKLGRFSTGILMRLALPIMLVACIAGILFWADPDKRLDNTVTLLLTVSALYISIFASVPLVGYATIMDKFVFAMFIILSACIFAHISYYLTTKAKEELKQKSQTIKIDDVVIKKRRKLKSKQLLIFLLQLFGRVLIPVLPIIVGFFTFEVQLISTTQAAIEGVVFGICFIAMVYFVVFKYSEKPFTEKMVELATAVREDTDSLTIDVLIVDIWTYFYKQHAAKVRKSIGTSLTSYPVQVDSQNTTTSPSVMIEMNRIQSIIQKTQKNNDNKKSKNDYDSDDEDIIEEKDDVIHSPFQNKNKSFHNNNDNNNNNKFHRQNE